MLKLLTFSALLWMAILPQTSPAAVDTNKAFIESFVRHIQETATWGNPSTNGLRLGVEISNGRGAEQFRVFTYLYSESNLWLGAFPPNGYRLAVSLKGSDGKNVAKTARGDKITKRVGFIVRSQMESPRQGAFVVREQPIQYENPFNLLDCFDIERPGTNALTVIGNVYTKHSGFVSEMFMPAVSLNLLVTQENLDSYRAWTAK